MPDATTTYITAQTTPEAAEMTSAASVLETPALASAPAATVAPPDADADAEAISDEELEELLIKEITIDGMCGVY